MRNSLIERSKLELEYYADRIINSKPDRHGIHGAEVPWASGGWCFPRASIPGVLRQVQAALAAKAWFSEHGPAWAQPLPLDGREHAAMIRGGGPLYLLGMYTLSLEMFDYDYMNHPQFFPYACGVMDYPHTPEHIRTDPELLEAFPPAPLPGLYRQLWFGGKPQINKIAT
jgi:hypothetical protein